MDGENNSLQTKTIILAIMQTENPKATDNITGQIPAITKEHLEMASGMAKVNGEKIKTSNVTTIKENMQMIKKLVKEYMFGNQVIDIKDTFLMILDRDLERCIGLMGLAILEIGKKVYKMDRDSLVSPGKD